MQILRISMKSGDRRSLRSFSSEVFARRRSLVLLGVYLLDLVKAELPDVAQRIASLEWISWIDFPSRYARYPGTPTNSWHDCVVLADLGWVIYLAVELGTQEAHVRELFTDGKLSTGVKP